MKFDSGSLKILEEALETMGKGFAGLPQAGPGYDEKKVAQVLQEAAARMQDNYPYFHPYYAGQMLKPPHPIARLAYMLSLWINPNNHALDGGRASSGMEKEAVAEIAALFGWQKFLGHLCGGGTMANLEGLWIAGLVKPGKITVASDQAHYTHKRISEVLKLQFKAIPCGADAGMDLEALEDVLKSGSVGTVVATMGTTGTGSLDPLSEILKLREKYGFRVHVDAAYGGYFILARNLDRDARREYESMGEADSIVIDPHKHGLQPYGCGCILFKDPSVGAYYKHDSPYTYFSSPELHLGEISLECSRPGASAVALWATQKLLPLVQGGEFAAGLEKSREAALLLYDRISGDKRFRTIMPPKLDIVVWAPVVGKASTISEMSKKIFENAARKNLHLAIFSYPSALLKTKWKDVDFDTDNVTCLRSVLMKPEHLDRMGEIWSILDNVMNEMGQT